MGISPYIAGLRAKIGQDLLMVASAAALIRDEADRVLLVRVADPDLWALPGGCMDPLERPADTAVREVWEETGLEVIPTGLVGAFSGPEFQTTYANGDRINFLTTIFRARVTGGSPRRDPEEIADLGWFLPEELRELPLAPWLRAVLDQVLEAPPGGDATFRPPTWRPPTAGPGPGA